MDDNPHSSKGICCHLSSGFIRPRRSPIHCWWKWTTRFACRSTLIGDIKFWYLWERIASPQLWSFVPPIGFGSILASCLNSNWNYFKSVKILYTMSSSWSSKSKMGVSTVNFHIKRLLSFITNSTRENALQRVQNLGLTGKKSKKRKKINQTQTNKMLNSIVPVSITNRLFIEDRKLSGKSKDSLGKK